MSALRETSKGLLIGLLVLALFAVAVTAIWFIKYQTAEVRGKINAHETVQSANSRLANYNHFFDLCAAIQGYESALKVHRATLAELVSAKADTHDIDRTRTVIAAVSAQRGRAIAQYNVDARKEGTMGQFRDAALPYQLNDDSAGKTQCVN